MVVAVEGKGAVIEEDATAPVIARSVSTTKQPSTGNGADAGEGEAGEGGAPDGFEGGGFGFGDGEEEFEVFAVAEGGVEGGPGGAGDAAGFEGEGDVGGGGEVAGIGGEAVADVHHGGGVVSQEGAFGEAGGEGEVLAFLAAAESAGDVDVVGRFCAGTEDGSRGRLRLVLCG